MQSDDDTRSRSKTLLWVGIVLMCAGPALGLVGLIAGMSHSFATIEREPAPTPAMLAQGVQWSLVAALAGMIVGAIGVALAVFAILKRRRANSEAVGWN